MTGPAPSLPPGLAAAQPASPPASSAAQPAKPPTPPSKASTKPAKSAKQQPDRKAAAAAVVAPAQQSTLVSPPAARQPAPYLANPIFWVDLEMTGLDPIDDNILEVACIASDGDLGTLIEGPELVIHHDDERLATMSQWSSSQHGTSGLTERCRRSTVTLADAESALLSFIRMHSDCRPHTVILGGACVYTDKCFLEAHMPRLKPYLSHRVVDVSTVRELAKRWYPTAVRQCPRADPAHRALDDIRYSINELRYYRDSCFVPREQAPPQYAPAHWYCEQQQQQQQRGPQPLPLRDHNDLAGGGHAPPPHQMPHLYMPYNGRRMHWPRSADA